MSKAAELANLIGNINAGGGGAGRNMVINGAFNISQRVGDTASTGNNYDAMPDRFRVEAYATSTFQQVTDAPTGFKNSFKVTCGNASLPGASNTYRIQHGIEGQNIAHLLYGTSQAKTATLSFYVKASETGVYSTALVNVRPGNTSSIIASTATRSHIKTYTVSSADTWEYKTLTFEGCPDGTWGSSNLDGISICFDLGSGSDHVGDTDTWLSTSDTISSSQVTLGDNNGGTWQITGIQFEVGQNATEFEHKTFEQELAECQRYYFKFLEGNNQEIGVGWYYSSSHISFMCRYPTTMRATPTGKDSTGTDYYTIYRNGGNDPFNSVTFENGSTEQFSALNSSEVSGTAGQAGIVRATNASAKIEFDSEL